MKSRKKNPQLMYSYRETRYSGRGIAAIILGSISLVILTVEVILSLAVPEGAAELRGAIGATAFIIAGIGVIEGMESFRDNCRSYMPSRIGTIFSAIMLGGWFLIFCVGMASMRQG